MIVKTYHFGQTTVQIADDCISENLPPFIRRKKDERSEEDDHSAE